MGGKLDAAKTEALKALIRQTIDAAGREEPGLPPSRLNARLKAQVGGDADLDALIAQVMKERRGESALPDPSPSARTGVAASYSSAGVARSASMRARSALKRASSAPVSCTPVAIMRFCGFTAAPL